MMENITAISIHAAYGLAVLVFIATMAGRFWLRGQDAGAGMSPPRLPVGKVSAFFYLPVDLLGIAGLAGFYYLISLASASVPQSDEAPAIGVFDLVFNIGLQFFLAGLVLIVVVGRIRPVKWLGLKWKQWPWILLIGPMTVFAMWAIFAGLYSIGYMDLMDKLGVEKVQDTVALFQETQDMNVLILMAITAAIVAPICEEVVFRGYLYPVMKRFAGPWVGAVVSALVFSAAHGSVSAMVPLFLFGVVLVVLYEFTGSIWAPMAVHFLFNSATVGVQLLVRFGFIPESAMQ